MDTMQQVFLTGGLVDPTSPLQGAPFDVSFVWDISTSVASDFQVGACSAYGFTGPQTESVSIVGDTIHLSGTCGANLFWNGSVVEAAPSSSDWVGQVQAVDPPTVSALEPGTAMLMMLGIFLAMLFSYRREYVSFESCRKCHRPIYDKERKVCWFHAWEP